MIDLGARLDRNDRHVRRIRLSLHHAAARARIEFALSETLRLMTLPGEDQGRVYYVRRVNVKDVAADGNRAIWLDKMQSAFSALADRAMHGNDRRAVASDVVFFHSHDEALELLLGRIVKREPFAEWFWPLVSSCELDSSRGEQIAAIVERLRELPGSWARVAQVLFALHDDGGTIDVVAALPLANVARWLRELGAERLTTRSLRTLRCPKMSNALWRERRGGLDAMIHARYGWLRWQFCGSCRRGQAFPSQRMRARRYAGSRRRRRLPAPRNLRSGVEIRARPSYLTRRRALMNREGQLTRWRLHRSHLMRERSMSASVTTRGSIDSLIAFRISERELMQPASTSCSIRWRVWVSPQPRRIPGSHRRELPRES